jgi:hypothetical protein
MFNFKTLTLCSALTVISLSALAQTPPPDTATPRADKRETKQETRIQNGVTSGQLNTKETGRLEQQQANINQTKSEAKADGVVTRKERRHIERQQDRASKNIHAQKHDPKKGS